MHAVTASDTVCYRFERHLAELVVDRENAENVLRRTRVWMVRNGDVGACELVGFLHMNRREILH